MQNLQKKFFLIFFLSKKTAFSENSVAVLELNWISKKLILHCIFRNEMIQRMNEANLDVFYFFICNLYYQVVIKLTLSLFFTLTARQYFMLQQMNKTNSTIRSFLSDTPSSKKSFRVLIKNRITHETLDPELEKIKTPNNLLTSTNQDESFQCVKDNLKKYIKNMKATSKLGAYQSKINTNRSSSHLSQKNSKMNSSRASLHSSKHIGRSLRSSFVQKQKGNLILNEKIQRNQNQDTPLIGIKNSVRYHTQGQESHNQSKLPLLRKNSQPNEQPSFNDQNLSVQIHQTTQRQRIRELENKIEVLLVQRLKMLSSTNSFSSNQQVKNKTAYKLLEKEMDRVLQQIRKIKQTQEIEFQTIDSDIPQRDLGINKNIEMLQKKVKIIERLIAQKLFEADNLRNQYLEKIKQNRSAIYERKSKSSILYRDANNINPSKFKPQPYAKSPVFQNDRTTNRAAYKMPLKSYYITPQKNTLYNSNKLTQPLPRSTYNCQYLIYGAIPKQLIAMESGQPDHKIFSNTLSDENQKNILKGSTYKDDFVKKFDKEPINFKQLDCYKDKFRNLQVNYGNDKHEGKIVNSRSVMEFYEEDKKKTSRSKLQSYSTNKNQQKVSDFLVNCQRKGSDAKSRVQELNRSIDQMKQSETKVSMIQQEQLRKNNLFHQRIKSQIKHKNVYDQKYRFKNQLMKQRIRKMQGLSKKNTITSTFINQN